MFLNFSSFKHFRSSRLDLNITGKNQNWQISNKNTSAKCLPCRSNYKISEFVAPGIHTGEGFAKVWEPSSAIAETDREKEDGISWGRRPVPAYVHGNFCPIMHSEPLLERLLEATQSPNTKFLSITQLTLTIKFTESQKHRMVGVGRDLCGSSSPTSCRSRVTYSRL